MVVGRATYEVAEDGWTMTATVCGLDATGNSFDQVIVFDRENPSISSEPSRSSSHHRRQPGNDDAVIARRDPDET
jgi:hypothetical protein